MQTTLLSIAIGLILALVAALVAPHFIRWNDHRAFFEAEASRLIGVKVRVGGDIDAAILPLPSVTLRAIAIGPPGQGSRMRARSVRLELALGPLMRGELRANEVKFVAPQLNIGLDAKGEVDWPPLAFGNEALSIDRLTVENGRVTLTDAGSGTNTVLDQLWFAGDVRSLSGPVRGKGEFTTGGGLYGYELSAGRGGPEGVRVKVNLKTEEDPLTLELDGQLSLDRGSPRFEGGVSLSRPAGVALPSGKTLANEPWRLISKVKASPSSAALDDIAFQYGPDERAVALIGAGEFAFGKQPQLTGALSARQVDLDRVLASAETPRRLPLAAVQAFGELLGGALRPSWPVKLAVKVDALTLGGAAVQNVATELRSDGKTWTLDRLDFRAPGFTQVKVSGRLYPIGKGLGFAGGSSVDSNDPKTLVAWLAGHTAATAQYKPWHISGDVTLGADRIAVERMRTQFDRGTVEGSLSYTWPAGDKPARLNGELRAGELDLDAVFGFGKSALSGLGLERPGEIAVAFEIGKARIAGIDARNIAARLALDAKGLAIERLSVGDLGDTSLVATGRIQTTSPPGGAITVNLDARDVSGILALADRFTPALADPLHQLAAGQKTATLQANVSLQDSGGGNANGKIGLNGQLGSMRVALSASATGKRDAFTLTDAHALSGTEVRLEGQFEADQPAPVLALLGLERLGAMDGGPARLRLAASGPLGRELKLEAKLQAGSVDAGGKGVLKLPASEPVRLDLEQVTGTIGGNKVQGKLAFRFGSEPSIDGSLESDALDAASIIVAAIGGTPRQGQGWSGDPLTWNAPAVGGSVAFKAQRATLLPGLVAQGFKGTARFGRNEVVFEDIAGEVAKGKIEGRLALSEGAEGLSARLRLALADADVRSLLGGERSPGSGNFAFQTEMEGVGRSPAALIGSLTGYGTMSLEKAQITGLNPDVFGIVTRAVELGIPTDGRRLREFVTGAIDGSGLPVSSASASISINAGQARLRDTIIRAEGADVHVTANLDLSNAMLDALLTLDAVSAGAGGVRPAILVALKGTLPQPERTLDISLLTSWLTLRAVEQQSKQIDAIEKARREAVTPAVPPSAEQSAEPALASPISIAPDAAMANPANANPGNFQAPARPSQLSPTGRPRAAPRNGVTPPANATARPPDLFGAQN